MDKIKLMDQLELDEGLRLLPYKCSEGRYTIGVGRNFQDNPFTIDELIFLGIKGRTFDAILEELKNKGITKGDALWLLERDVDKVYEQLKKQFGWFEFKPDIVQRTLCNLCFNVGLTRLLGFTKTLNAIKYDRWETAARELMNSKYAAQVGDRAKRLSNALMILSE